MKMLERVAIFLAAWLVLAVAMTGCTCVHHYYYHRPPPRYVSEPPPAQKAESPPARVSESHVWVAGHWDWNEAEAEWEWVAGVWEVPPSEEAEWEEPTYEDHDGNWVYVPGYWISPELEEAGGDEGAARRPDIGSGGGGIASVERRPVDGSEEGAPEEGAEGDGSPTSRPVGSVGERTPVGSGDLEDGETKVDLERSPGATEVRPGSTAPGKTVPVVDARRPGASETRPDIPESEEEASTETRPGTRKPEKRVPTETRPGTRRPEKTVPEERPAATGSGVPGKPTTGIHGTAPSPKPGKLEHDVETGGKPEIETQVPVGKKSASGGKAKIKKKASRKKGVEKKKKKKKKKCAKSGSCNCNGTCDKGEAKATCADCR